MPRNDQNVPLPKALEELLRQSQLEITATEAEFVTANRARVTSRYVNLAADDNPLSPYEEQLLDGSHDYDPDAIYTRSTNKFDHSSTMHTPFPRQVISMVQAIVSSNLVPEYRTPHDFIRNAVLHQLHREADRFEQITPALTIERMASWVDQQRAEVANLDKITEDYIDRMRTYRERERWEALAQLVPKAETVAEQFGNEWGDAIMVEVRKANLALGAQERNARNTDN